MDIKRISSALLGFPLVLVILIIGNKYVVDIALSIIAIMSMHEYFNAMEKEVKPIRWVGYLSCLSIAVLPFVSEEILKIGAILAIPTIMLLMFFQVVVTNMKTTVKDMLYTFFGICYVVLFLLFLALVNNMDQGKFIIWYLIFAAWGTDVFAFFTGILIGKHKFSKVSPKKTVEGCIGGTIGAIILMLLYTYVLNTYFNIQYSYIFIGIVALILSIIGQIGDFAASSIKRYVGIKDYSNLIPGHGGMLDRIDSLIFIAPFAYIIFSIF